MRFKDSAPVRPWLAFWQEVEPLRSRNYGKEEILLAFGYIRGSQERKISIELSKEEAKELRDELDAFLYDDKWD